MNPRRIVALIILLSSPKLLASRFCILWLKINLNDALIKERVAFFAILFK